MKAAGKFIGGLLGGKKDAKKQEDTALGLLPWQINAGLLAVHAAEAAEAESGDLTPSHAHKVTKSVRANHPVFTSLEAVPTKDGGWEYQYSAERSPK